MYKAIFVLVPSFSDSAWLNNKMMQITKSFISITNKGYPIEVVESYDAINQFLDKAEFIVVATAGTVILEPDHIWSKLHSIPDNVGLLANLLQHQTDITPYFHEQFFIIRTAAFRNLNFNNGHSIGKELCRSIEDMHGGWAPLFITLKNKNVKRHNKFGTQLIEECLENNYVVSNWDADWRYPKDRLRQQLPSRGFCYPTRVTRKFEKALKSLTVEEGLDDAQSLFIKLINELLEFNVLNAWHFEEPVKFGYLDTVISPATGFLGELIALNAGSKNLILYDTNSNNIEFKKHLYEHWDGKDYNSFVLEWCKDKEIAIEPLMDSDLEISNLYKENVEARLFLKWKEWKNNTHVTFLEINLLDNTQEFLDLIKDDTLLYTSTILSRYPMTHIKYSEEEIKNTKEKIIKTINKYSNSFWRQVL